MTSAASQARNTVQHRQHTNFYLRMLRNTNKTYSQLERVRSARTAVAESALGIRVLWSKGSDKKKKSLSRSAYSPDRAPDSHTSVQPGPGQPFSAGSRLFVARQRDRGFTTPAHRFFSTSWNGLRKAGLGPAPALPGESPSSAIARHRRNSSFGAFSAIHTVARTAQVL